MTDEELKALIQQVVDECLKQPLTASEQAASVLTILKTIEQRRWTPAGTPKASQMIIEERDQWQGMS